MTTDTVSTPPLAMQSYEFLVVIDGQPDRVDIQLGYGIEEAQQALQVKYGPQAQITFKLIIPDWINKKHDPYNIPTESQRLQAELEPIAKAPQGEQDALAND